MKSIKTQARTVVPAVTGAVLALGFAAACSAPLVGVLAEGKDLQGTCPKGQLLASDVRLDASGTFVAADISAEIESVLRDVAARTAVCGGHLRVSAFSGSSAGTVTLFDEELVLHGATENSRFRRIPGVQDHVVDEVSEHYGNFEGLDGGSDIVGQFRLADEYVRQLGEKYVLSEVIVTDGLQNDVVNVEAARNRAEAKAMARRVSAPDLSGSEVAITGLGNRNGVKPSSQQVETVVAFYTALCARMKVASCLPSTEYVSKTAR